MDTAVTNFQSLIDRLSAEHAELLPCTAHLIELASSKSQELRAAIERCDDLHRVRIFYLGRRTFRKHRANLHARLHHGEQRIEMFWACQRLIALHVDHDGVVGPALLLHHFRDAVGAALVMRVSEAGLEAVLVRGGKDGVVVGGDPDLLRAAFCGLLPPESRAKGRPPLILSIATPAFQNPFPNQCSEVKVNGQFIQHRPSYPATSMQTKSS